MEVFSNGRVKVVRAVLDQAGALVLATCATTPAAPGEPADLTASDGSRPCLAFLAGWNLLQRCRVAQRITADVDRLRNLPAGRVLAFAGAGRAGDDCFTALDCVYPVNLGVRLTEWRFLGWEEAGRILVELARALAEAHAVGLFAGALEPWQVQLASGGRVGLALFGPALALTVRGDAHRPLAPELEGDPGPSETSDLFSLGVMGVELLTGKIPQADSLAAARTPEAMRALIHGLAGREFDLPGGVVGWLAGTTSPEPAGRPGSARVAADMLDQAVHGEHEQACLLVEGELAPGERAASAGPAEHDGEAPGEAVRTPPPGRRPVQRSTGLASTIGFAVVVGTLVWLAATLMRSGLVTGDADAPPTTGPATRREVR